MDRFRRGLLLLAAVAAVAVSCRRAVSPTPPQYEPAESLLTIVAEFQRYRDADLYRFPYPTDLSGQNVFKATLVRLSNYQTLYPNKYAELIAYTRAQAYARLGEYETAARFCREAAEYGGELARRADECAARVEALRKAAALPRRASNLADYRRGLEERVRRCRQLTESTRAEPWASLAHSEWEQAEVDLVEFLWANRQVIDDGPKQAIDRLEAIHQRHRNSKNAYCHTMRLGDWAYEMATEYVTLFVPERATFLWEEFARWTARAKSFYLEVAQSYGARERQEAAAKLAAVEAFENRVRQRNR